MAEVFKLNDPESRNRLLEKMAEEDPDEFGALTPKRWEDAYRYLDEKVADARTRGLFVPSDEFTNESRALVVEAAVTTRPSMDDPFFTFNKIFPESYFTNEWFLNCRVYRADLLVLRRPDMEILRSVMAGENILPSPREIAAVLLFGNQFGSLQDVENFILRMGKENAPRARSPETLWWAAHPLVRELVLESIGESFDPLELALFLFDHGVVNDPHRAYLLLSGRNIVASYQHTSIGKERVAYLTVPSRIYDYSILVEFTQFDILLDPGAKDEQAARVGDQGAAPGPRHHSRRNGRS